METMDGAAPKSNPVQAKQRQTDTKALILFSSESSHARGHRFEFCSLHQSNIIRIFSPSGTGSDLLFAWTIFLYSKTALATSGRGRYSFSNLVSILIQHPFQQSIQHSFPALLSNVQTPFVPLDCRRTPEALGADRAPNSRSQSRVQPSLYHPSLGSLQHSQVSPPFCFGSSA